MSRLVYLFFLFYSVSVFAADGAESQTTPPPSAGPQEEIRENETLPPSTAAPEVAKTESSRMTIKQLMIERNRAVVESSQPLQVGSELIATFPEQKQCALKVVAVDDKLANVDTSSCARAADLIVGQSLDPSLAIKEEVKLPPPIVTPKAPEEPRSAVNYEELRRELTDLQYMPSQKQWAVVFGYQQSSSDTRTDIKSNGKQITDVKTERDSLGGSLYFGLAKELAMSVGWGWVTNGSTETAYGPGSIFNGIDTKVRFGGYTDPSIGFKYRVTEMNHYNVITDVTSSAIPLVQLP